MRHTNFLSLILILASVDCSAFESTKILPKGVRNLNIKDVYTTTSTKTDHMGNKEPLAEALWRPLRFKDILSGEIGLKRKQLEAFLISEKFSKDDTAGEFRANLDAQINVLAPILALGMSDRLTLGIAVPYYRASTDIKVGFNTDQGANKFLAALTAEGVNNYQSAIEASKKFQNAVPRLNQLLLKNSYHELSKWSENGWGDLTIALKYLGIDDPNFKLGSQVGLVAPTGKIDNPNILNDLPYGDGQWDFFAMALTDEFLTSSIFFNQFIKYTFQNSALKETRWKTAEEPIEAALIETSYKLGDKIDAGFSLQFEQEATGLNGGIGTVYYKKFSDRYQVSSSSVKNELQKDTDQSALYWEAKIGYSSLSAFRRKEIPLPFSANLEFKKQYLSQNIPVTDFTQIDLNFFF